MENVLRFDYLTVVAAIFQGLLNVGARLSFQLYKNSENMFFCLHLTKENNEDQETFSK